MVKRSTNLVGRHGKGAVNEAKGLIAAFRLAGMTDEEIKAKLLEMKQERDGKPQGEQKFND